MNLRDGIANNISYLHGHLPSTKETLTYKNMERALCDIEKMQAVHTKSPNYLIDNQIVEIVQKERTRKSSTTKSIRMTGMMASSLKRVMKKARTKIRNRTIESRTIKGRKTVEKQKKMDQLKMAGMFSMKHKREKNYLKKVAKVENYIKNFYNVTQVELPLDMLQALGSKQSMLSLVRYNLNKKMVKNKFTTKGADEQFYTSHRIKKQQYQRDVPQIATPESYGKLNIRESSSGRLFGALTGANSTRRNRMKKPGINSGREGVEVDSPLVDSRRHQRRGGASTGIGEALVDVVDKGKGILGTEGLLKFSQLLVQQGGEESEEEYEKIFQHNFDHYYKFHFEHLSQNSLNFLVNFVKHFILDRYFVRNYDHKYELDDVSQEVEDPDSEEIYDEDDFVYHYHRHPDSSRPHTSRQPTGRSRVSAGPVTTDPDSEILREFSRYTYLNDNVARRKALRKSLQDKNSEIFNQFRRSTLRGFMFNSGTPDSKEKILMTGHPSGRAVDPPLFPILKCKKFENKRYIAKYFKFQAGYMFYHSMKNDLKKEKGGNMTRFLKKCRGYVALSSARVGIKLPEKDYLSEHLTLYPRHDGNPLEIRLDENGEALRRTLLKVLSLLELQKMVLDSSINEGYKFVFGLMNENHEGFKEIRINVKALSPAVDGKLFRALSMKPVLRVLSLINIRFSSNGIARLGQLLVNLGQKNPKNNITKLELVNNGLEAYNSTRLFKVICDYNLGSVSHLTVSKNKVGDGIIIQVINSLANHMSKVRGTNLVSLDLSESDLSDASVLALQSFFDNFTLRNQLISLSLSGNNVTENGLTYLADLITRKRVVGFLDISRCRMISDEFLGAFLSLIRDNRSLITVDYSHNLLQKKTIQNMLNFLYRNMYITDFRVSVDGDMLRDMDLERFHTRLSCFRMRILERSQVKRERGKAEVVSSSDSTLQLLSLRSQSRASVQPTLVQSEFTKVANTARSRNTVAVRIIPE